MTREEAIEILKDDAYVLYEDDSPYNRQAYDMAIEALKFRGAYEMAVKAANKAFENRWTQWVEWIPVSERLPEALQAVLVTSTKGHVYISHIVHGEFEYGGDVVAWMPLPEPYKGDEE